MSEIEFNSSVVPDYLVDWYNLEEAVFNVSEDKIQEICKLAEKFVNSDNSEILRNLILRASTVRRFLFKPLSKLWAKLEPLNIVQTNTVFLNYLSLKGLIDQKMLYSRVPTDKSVSEIEQVFKENTLLYNISKDDTQKVVYESSNPGFYDQKATIDVNEEIDLISFAAFCGSLNVFKYFLLNNTNYKITNDTLINAVKGGKEEIIEILAQQADLDGCFKAAIEYHRNNIAEWLFENYKCEEISLNLCVLSMNTQAMCFLVQNGNDMESLGSDRCTPLINAINISCIAFVNYLLINGVNVENNERTNEYTPLLIAAQKGNLGIVKLLVEKGADIESKGVPQFSPLFMAAKFGHKDIVEYLVEHGANLEGKEDANWTPLMIASFGGFEDICQYLRSKGANQKAKAKESRFFGVAKPCAHRRYRH